MPHQRIRAGLAGGVSAIDWQGDADDEAGVGAAKPQPADWLGRHRLGGVGWLLAIMSVTIGVSMVPGPTALMRIPRGAYSRAALLVSPMVPCLEPW